MTTTTFGRLARTAALSAALCAATALAALAQSDPLANCRYYTKTQADFEQGLKHCQAAIEKYPEDPEARFYGAWCLAETGHWGEAWTSFSWLIERMDSSDKKVRKHAEMAEKQALFYYQSHFNRGLELVEAQKYEEADAEFAIATQIYPSKVDAYLNRGFTQTQRNDLDGALVSFETAVSMDPKHAQAPLYYWDALNQKLKALRNAELRDSTAIGATTEKLHATLQTVLENPDLKTDDRAAAYLQLADLAFAKGDNEKAIEYVTKATEIAPEKITELYNMGIEFYNADDYGPAIQALRTVMTQVDDESDEIWRRSLYVVGLSSLYTEDWAGCIAAMDKLISLDPANMDYYLNRAKAHAKAGNESAAAADYAKWEKMKEAAATGSSE